MKIKHLTTLTIVSFLLHLIWENAQAPLFTGYTSFTQHLPICLLGTIGDIIFTLLVYFGISLLKNDFEWILRLEPISKIHFCYNDHNFGCKALIPPQNNLGYSSLGFGLFARNYGISLRKRFLRWVLSKKDIFVLAVIGFFFSIGIEWRALLFERWSYADAMPIIPYLGVALMPVLQMIVLLPLSFYLTKKVYAKI